MNAEPAPPGAAVKKLASLERVKVPDPKLTSG
jgi:hypothetical protein